MKTLAVFLERNFKMDVKKVLKDNNFSFKTNFGQNFLTDKDLLERIVKVANVRPTDAVLEIGVGAGTLTYALSKAAQKVVGYEIDKSLKPVLEQTLADSFNVEIVFADALKTKIEQIEDKIGKPYRLVSNLPYYITTPLIMKFITEAKKCVSITAMVQKEVALRLCAGEGSSEYGAITAGIDVVGDSEIIAYVDKTKFMPMPKVDSAVVNIVINKDKYAVKSMKKYRDVVRCAFSSRRKTLVNNLINAFPLKREQAEEILTQLDIDVTARGETLSTERFVELANYLTEKGI